MLLALDSQPWFDEMYNRVLNKLSDRAQLVPARSVRTAVNFLENNQPTAIFATDSGLTERENVAVVQKVKNYVSSGGRAIFGGNFSSFVHTVKMGPFFRTNFGLPWDYGDYTRDDLFLNMDAVENLPSQHQLASKYSQKAVYVKIVDSLTALYLRRPEDDDDDALDEGYPPPRIVETISQTPAAWASVGQGWVGYTGDVNAEEDTDAVVLAMCGL